MEGRGKKDASAPAVDGACVFGLTTSVAQAGPVVCVVCVFMKRGTTKDGVVVEEGGALLR